MAYQFKDLTDLPLTIDNTLSNNTSYTNNFNLNQTNSNHRTNKPNFNSNSTTNACKCGSYLHQKTNHGPCILNKKNLHFIPSDQFMELILNRHNERRTNLNSTYQKNYRIENHQKIENNRPKLRFLNIARVQFSMDNIFGKYIVTNKNDIDYGRNIIPSRILQFHKCQAYVWSEERTGGTKNNPLYSICCCLGIFIFIYTT